MNLNVSSNKVWGTVCATCGTRINYLDLVRYWNTERQEMYCGAQCSLNRHEEIRNFETPQQQGLYVKLT